MNFLRKIRLCIDNILQKWRVKMNLKKLILETIRVSILIIK